MESIELNSTLDCSRELLGEIQLDSGVNIQDCYQCGKCSAGCPLNLAMDYTPHKIMRLLQLGMTEQALSARSIWVCVACTTCYDRCPKGVDVPKIMETLRIEAKKRKQISVKTVDVFSDSFLWSVENFGRVQEALLIVIFNLKTFQPLKDVPLSPKLLLNGKVHPIPKRAKGHAVAKRIFANCRQMGGNC